MLGFEEEYRDYSSIPTILDNLSLSSVKLITNNPYKLDQLKALGISITGRVPIVLQPNTHSEHYLHTKASRMGHML